jgi:hypothetical protein
MTLPELLTNAKCVFLIASTTEALLPAAQSAKPGAPLLLAMMKGPATEQWRLSFFKLARRALIASDYIQAASPLAIYIQDPSSMWTFGCKHESEIEDITNYLIAIASVAQKKENKLLIIDEVPDAAQGSVTYSASLVTMKDTIDIVNGPFCNMVNKKSPKFMPPITHVYKLESIC